MFLYDFCIDDKFFSFITSLTISFLDLSFPKPRRRGANGASADATLPTVLITSPRYPPDTPPPDEPPPDEPAGFPAQYARPAKVADRRFAPTIPRLA